MSMLFSDFMRENGLSVERVSVMLGLADKSSLYRYLNGKRKPSPEVMDKIHRLTQGRVSLAELVAQKTLRQAKAASRDEEEQRRRQQALYCGFSEQFIRRQQQPSVGPLPIWQKWDVYYAANDNLPFPIWQSGQIFGPRFHQDAKGQYWLDGRVIDPKQLVQKANCWLVAQGHVPIQYPSLPHQVPNTAKSTSRVTVKTSSMSKFPSV